MESIYVKKAHTQDVPAIEYLFGKYGQMKFSPDRINQKDISLVARLDTGQLVGYLWCGLMSKGKLAYVDHFVTDPVCAGLGVGHLLAREMRRELVKRGVKEIFGLIKQDEFHDASAMNAGKIGLGAGQYPYTYVFGDVKRIDEMLTKSGVN